MLKIFLKKKKPNESVRRTLDGRARTTWKPTTTKIHWLLVVAFFLSAPLGCAPKVYIIDRTTLLEEEAAGSWPDLESQWTRSQIRRTPQPGASSETSRKQKRLTRVLEPDAVKK